MLSECGVAIVGGGCSGLLVAVQLFRHGFQGPVIVIEPRERLGAGLAYSTPFDQHLLNVSAGKMSALPGHPAHFLDWLRAHHWPEAGADSFAPRKLYGQYLRDLLQQTITDCDPAAFRHIRAEVTHICKESGAARLTLSDGTTIHADKTVLALGNPASSPEPGPSRNGMESRWHLSPWFGNVPGEALKVRFAGERILVLGTGLTAVDCVLALQSDPAACEVVMLSRRGILPQVHDLRATAVKPPRLADSGSLRAMLRELRAGIETASQPDLHWRAAIDALRPASNEIWRDLSAADKARFLRHLKSYWEPHRHRMAPEIRARLDGYLASGAVRIIAGRVRGVRCHGDIVNVRILPKHGAERTLDVNRIISCTGIHEKYAANDAGASRPLIRSLVESGLARANDLGIGFHTDEHGALLGEKLGERLGETPTPSPVLFTIGPPRRGQLFETTAVPEIRVQAEELAVHLLRQAVTGP